MPPTMPIVSAFEFASDSLTSLSPKAVPAALSIPSRIAATPIATSQPKNAAPQLRPPYSSRCRARTSRTASRPVAPALRCVALVACEPAPLLRVDVVASSRSRGTLGRRNRSASRSS